MGAAVKLEEKSRVVRYLHLINNCHSEELGDATGAFTFLVCVYTVTSSFA